MVYLRFPSLLGHLSHCGSSHLYYSSSSEFPTVFGNFLRFFALNSVNAFQIYRPLKFVTALLVIFQEYCISIGWNMQPFSLAAFLYFTKVFGFFNRLCRTINLAHGNSISTRFACDYFLMKQGTCEVNALVSWSTDGSKHEFWTETGVFWTNSSFWHT